MTHLIADKEKRSSGWLRVAAVSVFFTAWTIVVTVLLIIGINWLTRDAMHNFAGVIPHT
jgi:hypothetical protein